MRKNIDKNVDKTAIKIHRKLVENTIKIRMKKS